MAFALTQRSADWIDGAPIRLVRDIELCAPAATVFATIADHTTWPTWFKRMRRVRIDGSSSGVGALRSVWVGAARVQESFVRWDTNQRLTFDIVASNLPGMAAMTEDWLLTERAENHTTLTITVGVEPAPLFRTLAPVIRAAVKNSTSGAQGIAALFPCDER